MNDQERPSDDMGPRDEHVHNVILFHREELDFFMRAMAHYAENLRSDLEALKSDLDLAAFLGPDFAENSRLFAELCKVEQVEAWLKNLRGRMADGWIVAAPMISHSTVRYIKTVALMYLEHITYKRDRIAASQTASRSMLSEVEAKLRHCKEFLASGAFCSAAPIEMMVSQLPPPIAAAGVTGDALGTTAALPHVVRGEVGLLDKELRARCMDLYSLFLESDQQGRLDTVLNEATRVLENRLRSLVTAPDGCDTKELIGLAFHPKKAQLVVSSNEAEQGAVHLLFLGVFGFIRNPVHHRLLGHLAPDRVQQTLGMIDYCLAIIDGASAPSP